MFSFDNVEIFQYLFNQSMKISRKFELNRMLKFFAIISLSFFAVNCENARNTSNSNITVNPFSECGIMSSTSGLVQGGKFSSRNQFPWSAIIATDLKLNGVFTHFGSGSLISSKHVIASSGGVSYLDGGNYLIPLSTRRVKVILGTTKFDLSQPEVMKVGVEKIVNNREARKLLPSLYIYRISIVVLEHDVMFTEFIRPVCIGSFGPNSIQFIENYAFAVGYGTDETGEYSLTRKHVRMTMTSCENFYDDLLLMRNLFAKDLRLFCATGNGMEGPCYKDNSFYIKSSSKWFLKGILTAVIKDGNGTCSVERSVMYEDVSSSIEWIQTQINSRKY